MSIDLGVLQLDDGVVIRQLRQDLKDDWFPDPRGFDDIFGNNQIHAVVTDNFRINAGSYRPMKSDILDVPKPNFTIRCALETGIADRVLYHGLVARLVPFYDPLLPWNVFNHRRSISRGSDKYLFRASIESWQDFIGTVRSSVKTSSALLSTDLTNYYEHIDLSILMRTMTGLLAQIDASPAEKGHLRAHLQFLFDCLREWCYTPAGGLPQNRDASSFLANIYMLPVDRVMLAHGYQYFRFMDDIKIVCQDVFEARRALKDLSFALREVKLSVNSGKTKICEPGDTKALAHCLDVGGSEMRQIAAIWQTRSLKPISRSFPLLKSLTLRLLREGDANERSFRFCIRRLEALARCPEFEVPDAYFADITPLIVDALTSNPAATDQLARYLRAVPVDAVQLDQIVTLVQDKRKNIYPWQSYYLWKLLIQKKHLDPQLMAYALDLVRYGIDDANRSGAVLYAGALGGKPERVIVAENFSKSGSFLGQRAALVAIQELHYKPHVRDHVQAHVRADLQGVYRGFNREGVYLAPQEITPITRFIDLDRSYG